MNNDYRCGYVALVGRPNVGKSTLINQLLAQKISITSHKAQTTRHRILGIKTQAATQIIYVDTPGLHQRQHNALNRYLNRVALSSLDTVEVIVWLVEALRWTAEDDQVLKALRAFGIPVILGVNKIDKVKDKKALLPYLQAVATKHDFIDVFPLSARQGYNLVALETAVVRHLPLGLPLFPAEQCTDRTERFLAAEFIREKLAYRLGAELPHRLTVQIEHFSSEKHLVHIGAIVWVERNSQKAIVIGKQGSVLKQVGELARKDIETLLDNKVFLQLWVKIKQGWCDSETALRQLGYAEE